MSDPKSEGDQPNSLQSSPDSSSAAKRETKDEKTIDKNAQTNSAHGDANQPIHSWRVWTTIGQGWRYVKSSEFTNLAMALATIAIAIFTWLTYEVVHSGSEDTRRLITAAETQARAAERFAASAAYINTGMGTAVDKLNLQANALNESVKQAARLANDTEIANSNIVNSDRPWMGASLGVEGFSVGSTPIYSVTFVNSGKRPARVTLTQTLAALYDFGDKPVYRPYDTTPSASVVVPGQSVVAFWKDDTVPMNPISDTMMSDLASGAIPFRIYAKIEYTDIRTGAQYWTHACWRFTPKRSANKIGFSNCADYNDAK